MDLESIELHDALLKKMDVDYVKNVVVVALEFYEDVDAPCRKTALITFEGVESISKICSLERMNQNAGAGNVNYWVPSQPGGTTFIYLVDGCISLTAQRVSLEIQ